jgi:prefoldin subunit 5
MEVNIMAITNTYNDNNDISSEETIRQLNADINLYRNQIIALENKNNQVNQELSFTKQKFDAYINITSNADSEMTKKYEDQINSLKEYIHKLEMHNEEIDTKYRNLIKTVEELSLPDLSKLYMGE